MELATAQTAATLVAQIEGIQAAITAVNTATTNQACLLDCDMTNAPKLDLSPLQLTAAETAQVGVVFISILNTRLAALNAQLAGL